MCFNNFRSRSAKYFNIRASAIRLEILAMAATPLNFLSSRQVTIIIPKGRQQSNYQARMPGAFAALDRNPSALVRMSPGVHFA